MAAIKGKLGYLAPTVVAILSSILYLALTMDHLPQRSTQGVVVGHDYYVSANLIELTDRNSDGEPWDSYNQSAPDVFYEIYWQGSRIFKSTVKEDSFVAKWSNAEINVTKIALSGGIASLDGIVQGARLNIRSDDKIELRIYDSDLVDNDLAGIKSFSSADLKLGETPYDYSGLGVKRIVLSVSDMSQAPDVSK